MALSAMIGALAIGAMWALLIPASRGLQGAAALLAGALMAWMMRSTARATLYAALLAAAGTLVAAIYASCLAASMRLSNELGIGFGDILMLNGVRGTLALGCLSLHARDLPWLAAGTTLALLLARLPLHKRGNA